MPRLQNVNSGAIVSTSDETASRMGSEWQPVKAEVTFKSPAKKTAASRKQSAPADEK